MPRTNRVSSRARLLLKTRPKRGALVRYGGKRHLKAACTDSWIVSKVVPTK